MVQGFGTYTALTGKPLTPDVTFSSLALFNQLALPLFILPMSLAMLVNGLVSTNRLLNFLLAPEVEGKENSVLDDEDDVVPNNQVRSLSEKIIIKQFRLFFEFGFTLTQPTKHQI